MSRIDPNVLVLPVVSASTGASGEVGKSSVPVALRTFAAVCLPSRSGSIIRPQRTYVENSELVFEDFDHVTFRWKDYGGTEHHEKHFDSGQVKFVPPIGTMVTVE